MAREPGGAGFQLGVGDCIARVAVGELAAALTGVAAQQLRYRGDEVRMQHGVSLRFFLSCQIMQKPPLMLSVWPEIQPECGDASMATMGAMSPGWPRRRVG